MISLDDPVWFSPLNVISHFKRIEAGLSDNQKSSKNFRKAKEVYAVAIMLVGIRKILDREFWLQTVDDREQSPDVRTGTFVPPRRTKSDDFSIQDVEVVEYGNNSDISLSDFLKETKLSKGKSYDAFTTILCSIKRDTHIPPLKDLQSELAALKVKCPVMILGRTLPEQETYKIAQINPLVDMVTEFNLIHELKNKKYKGVLSLRRGTTPQTDYRPEEKHFPFEKENMNGYLKYVIENCEVALAELCRINGELRAGMSPDSTADVNQLGTYNRMSQDYLIVHIAGLFDKDSRTISFANSFVGHSVVESARSEEIIQYILQTRNKLVAHSEQKFIEEGKCPETDKICNSNLKEILEKLKSLTTE